jgi:ribulose-5-phosphate 4-epimerase/fuculose-1-phosphate aldolase
MAGSAIDPLGLADDYLPKFDSDSVDEQRLHRKQRLAAAFRLFGRFGFDEGVAGHITARDPERPDHFWVNPFGMNFGHVRVSDLILVNDRGEVVEGDYPVNTAAFVIHSQVHAARPDVIAAAHAHSIYGKSWSTLARPLDPITQDVCAFYEDHALFDDYTVWSSTSPRASASRTRSATTRRSSCGTTGCSPWATRSTKPRGGSSRWKGPVRPSSSPRRRGRRR